MILSFFKKDLLNRLEIIKFKLKTKCKLSKGIELMNSDVIELGKNVSIGENSKILCWVEYTSGISIQKLNPSLSIGDNFKATSSLLIQCAGKVIIGNNVLIGRNVSIIDYNHGTNPLTTNYLDNDLIPKSIIIEDGSWIGNNTIILSGTHIGKKCIIGAGSVVTTSIEDYSIAVGNPAKVIKKFDFDSNTWTKV